MTAILTVNSTDIGNVWLDMFRVDCGLYTDAYDSMLHIEFSNVYSVASESILVKFFRNNKEMGNIAAITFAAVETPLNPVIDFFMHWLVENGVIYAIQHKEHDMTLSFGQASSTSDETTITKFLKTL